MIKRIAENIGGLAAHFVRGWLLGAGFVLGALNMWAYLGGVHP